MGQRDTWHEMPHQRLGTTLKSARCALRDLCTPTIMCSRSVITAMALFNPQQRCACSQTRTGYAWHNIVYGVLVCVCLLIAPTQANAHLVSHVAHSASHVSHHTDPTICCGTRDTSNRSTTTDDSVRAQHHAVATLVDFPATHNNKGDLDLLSELEEAKEKDPQRKLWYSRGPPRTLYAGVLVNAAVVPFLQATPCQTDRLVMTARAPPALI